MSYERERDQGNASNEANGYGHGRQRARRPVYDYEASLLKLQQGRRPKWHGGPRGERERPVPGFSVHVLPACVAKPADVIPAKQLHSSLNKIKHPVNIVRWTPEGRRLLTGSSSGEFTLWNGMSFNFETIMQAHDSAVRAATYSHDDNWLISADQEGYVKYWQPNFNNVQVMKAHTDAVRDLSFSPTDVKFATASDDNTIKIFDFTTGKEESVIEGHNWEVKSVDWNPSKGLIASGSKDHTVKLWDPRTRRCLTTFHNHKNTVARVSFCPTQPSLLATCAREGTARVWDLKMMRDVVQLRGHEKDITTLVWHPTHRSLLSTAGDDGALFHYLLNEQHGPPGAAKTISPYSTADPSSHPSQVIYPRHRTPFAHDWPIWSLDWHPLGHILVSGSNDRVTRFWSRPSPGDVSYVNDRFHIGEAAAEAQGTYDRRGGRRAREAEEMETLDEADGLVDQHMPSKQPLLPGINGPSMGDAGPPNPFFGMGAVPPPPNGLPGLAIPGLDPANPPNLTQLATLLGQLPPGSMPPVPLPLAGTGTKVKGLPPPPPMPGDFPGGVIPPGLLPPGFQFPPGFPIPPPPPPPHGAAEAAAGIPGLPGLHAGSGDGAGQEGKTTLTTRRRVPLPSQEESLREERKRQGAGRFAR